MRLDRYSTGVGKFSIIEHDKNDKVTHTNDPEDDFIVLKLKDYHTVAALDAYINSVTLNSGDAEYVEDLIRIRALALNHPHRKIPDGMFLYTTVKIRCWIMNVVERMVNFIKGKVNEQLSTKMIPPVSVQKQEEEEEEDSLIGAIELILTDMEGSRTIYTYCTDIAFEPDDNSIWFECLVHVNGDSFVWPSRQTDESVVDYINRLERVAGVERQVIILAEYDTLVLRGYFKYLASTGKVLREIKITSIKDLKEAEVISISKSRLLRPVEDAKET